MPDHDPTPADEITETQRRVARVASEMLRIAEQRLFGDPAAGIEPLDPNTLGWADLCALAEVGQRLERLAHLALLRHLQERS